MARVMYCTQFSSVVDAQEMARQVCANANCKTRNEFYDALADMTLVFDEAEDLQDDSYEIGGS